MLSPGPRVVWGEAGGSDFPKCFLVGAAVMAPVALSALQLEQGRGILFHSASSGSCSQEQTLCTGSTVLAVEVLSGFSPQAPPSTAGGRAGELRACRRRCGPSLEAMRRWAGERVGEGLSPVLPPPRGVQSVRSAGREVLPLPALSFLPRPKPFPVLSLVAPPPLAMGRVVQVRGPAQRKELFAAPSWALSLARARRSCAPRSREPRPQRCCWEELWLTRPELHFTRAWPSCLPPGSVLQLCSLRAAPSWWMGHGQRRWGQGEGAVFC